MQFRVLPSGASSPTSPGAWLLTDNWDDWFRFSTQYYLMYVDEDGVLHSVGQVKIGQFNMTEGQRRPALDDEFAALDDRFFSLGQDATYYEALAELGDSVRTEMLTGLRDMAFLDGVYKVAAGEEVTSSSLMRSVARTTVLNQFRRLAHGGRRLDSYHFSYVFPGGPDGSDVLLPFDVEAESNPPSNVHVLIGRNGVGKSRLLNGMTKAMLGLATDDAGRFEVGGSGQDEFFANLVSVSFSAFDDFTPLSPPGPGARRSIGGYTYVGLKAPSDSPSGYTVLSPDGLLKQFQDSLAECAAQEQRFDRLRRALQLLESDPIFNEAGIALLTEVKGLSASSASVWPRLSSGHKIVLLTVTRLVESVEERSLVLLDEPEAHLHPPLLSAFVRALSDLLSQRNGVAIIATHSPVVVQEVPSACAWRLLRSGNVAAAERLDIETFGENVGVLTREIFGLEVTRSGFHKLIADTVAASTSYDQVLAAFGGHLGAEAKRLAKALVAEELA